MTAGSARTQPGGAFCRAFAARAAALVCGVASCCGALGADVYASQAADGSVRYATQPLDASYRLLLSETQQPGLPLAPAKNKASARSQGLLPLIDRIAALHGVPVALVEAVVAIESGFDTAAVSPKGARGAMQLMPATARRYGVSDARTLHEPQRNIDAGVRHLKDLLARYDGNTALALAAYNAGAAAVARHGDRIPPYPETMLYVSSVLARSAASGARP